jgi:hypothetical protein
VAVYRVFSADDRQHGIGLPIIIDCPDDRTAAAYARQIADGRAVEIWDQSRFVAMISIEGKITLG